MGASERPSRESARPRAREVARLDDLARDRLAYRLRYLMRTRGFSGRELARRSGVPVTAIYGALNRAHQPSIGKLIALAAALGVSLDALFGTEVPERLLGPPGLAGLDGASTPIA